MELKRTNKTLRERFSAKKITLVILSVMIFTAFLPIISAFEFDNVGNYDENTRTMEIINAFGFGDTIAKIRLDSQLHVYVIPGDDRRIAEFTMYEFDKDYVNALEKIDLYDVETSRKFERDFSYRYKKIVGIRETENNICTEGKALTNGTTPTECSIGIPIREEIIEWIEFRSLSEVPEGNVTIGIFTNVYTGDYVEWIPTFFGIEINEWATWSASLEIGLVAWYDFQTTVGDLVDVILGTHDASVEGNPTRGVTGILGRAWTFDGTDDFANMSTNLQDFNFTNTGNLTISFWIIPDAVGSVRGLVTHNSDEDSFEIAMDAGDLIDTTFYEGTGGGAKSILNKAVNLSGSWQHIVLTTNGTYGSLWINSSLVGTVAYDGTLSSTRGTVLIGKHVDFNDEYLGDMDEIGIWNRTLSASEISDLYNGGIGISPRHGLSILSISLNTPTDNSIFTESSQNFNATIIPANLNITNATLFIWYSNTTRLTAVVNTVIGGNITNDSLFTASSIPLGAFDWNVFGCGINLTSSTFCEFDSSNFSFTRQAFATEQESYTAVIEETKDLQFMLNISTIDTILSVTANLIYENVSNPADSISCNASGFCQILRNLDLPLVTSGESENKTYHWQINVFDGSTTLPANTSMQTHNVSKIHFEKCGTSITVGALNLSVWDESDNSRINPFYSAGNFNFWLGGGSITRESAFSNASTSPEFNLCIKPADKNFSVTGSIEYNDVINSSTYNTRNYFFQQDIINNGTTRPSNDLELFLLNIDDSTSFILKVQDTNLLPITDALIFIDKLDLGTGNFTTVQVARTDDNGQTVGFFKTETVDYRFIIRKNGVILLQTNPQKVVPESAPFTLTFTVGVDEGAPWERFEGLDNLTSTLVFNATSQNVTFIYVDTSGTFTLGELIVTMQNNTGFGQSICNFNSTLTSATLICAIGNVTGTYTASGYITRGTTRNLVKQIIFNISDFAVAAGLYGLFLGWFLILISAFAFKFNEIAGIVLMNITTFFVNLIGLIDIGYLFIFGMMGVSLIIIVLLEK